MIADSLADCQGQISPNAERGSLLTGSLRDSVSGAATGSAVDQLRWQVQGVADHQTSS